MPHDTVPPSFLELWEWSHYGLLACRAGYFERKGCSEPESSPTTLKLVNGVQAILLSNQTAFSTFLCSDADELKAYLGSEFGRGVRVRELAHNCKQLHLMSGTVHSCRRERTGPKSCRPSSSMSSIIVRELLSCH